MKTSDYQNFKHRDQWRAWLDKNHADTPETWLIIYKKTYGDQGLTLEEAVEEALCFGWIDSTLRRVDGKRYALRFSPRTRKSIWAVNNIKRVEKLISAGKMMPAGYLKVSEATENGEWEAAFQREDVQNIPEELAEALRDHAGALPGYQALPDSRKKQLVHWLLGARKKSTREKRARKIVDEALLNASKLAKG